MLQTRLWMGSILIALAILILREEHWFAPWFPFLFVSYALATLLGTHELLRMIRAEIRPNPPFCFLVIAFLCVANWQQPIATQILANHTIIDSWHLLGFIFLIATGITFFMETIRFEHPDQHVERAAMTLLVFIYLGILPSFLVQLRWLEPTVRGTIAIAMTVFIPKCGDIGAYFTGKFLTGRIIGRNLMTPALSPKKTWQGAVGGILSSIFIAVVFQEQFTVFAGGIRVAVGYGLTVGFAGQVGDLAESLIKRDSGIKDASRTIPGFGGVLDVIDSLIFAAPVSYLWFMSC